MKLRYVFAPVFGFLRALLDLWKFHLPATTFGFGPMGLYGCVGLIVFLYWRESRESR